MHSSAHSDSTTASPEPGSRPLRILIADDHAVVREGARLLVESQPGWEVCAIATDGREAVDLAMQHRPDVIVLDLHMPQLDGVEAVRELKKQLPEAELVIFSGENSERAVEELFEAGVKSFIRKTDPPRTLLDAITSVSQHKRFFTPEISDIVFTKFLKAGSGKSGAGEKLTPRERQIVKLIADGKSNKQIADALEISTRTAEAHRATVMRKLNVDSTATLVRYAVRNGIVEP